jgi:hypothetical protein
MIALVVGSRVVRVIVRCEDTVFDERSEASRSKGFAEAHAVVALVSGEATKVACVPQGDLRTDAHPTRPLRTAVEVKDRSVGGVYQKRRLNRPYRGSCAIEVVRRCLLMVEVGGIDRGVTGLVEQLRRAAEQLSLDAHRSSLEWRGKLPAPKTQ